MTDKVTGIKLKEVLEKLLEPLMEKLQLTPDEKIDAINHFAEALENLFPPRGDVPMHDIMADLAKDPAFENRFITTFMFSAAMAKNPELRLAPQGDKAVEMDLVLRLAFEKDGDKDMKDACKLLCKRLFELKFGPMSDQQKIDLEQFLDTMMADPKNMSQIFVVVSAMLVKETPTPAPTAAPTSTATKTPKPTPTSADVAPLETEDDKAFDAEFGMTRLGLPVTIQSQPGYTLFVDMYPAFSSRAFIHHGEKVGDENPGNILADALTEEAEKLVALDVPGATKLMPSTPKNVPEK